jgi:hypothetical protein
VQLASPPASYTFVDVDGNPISAPSVTITTSNWQQEQLVYIQGEDSFGDDFHAYPNLEIQRDDATVLYRFSTAGGQNS